MENQQPQQAVTPTANNQAAVEPQSEVKKAAEQVPAVNAETPKEQAPKADVADNSQATKSKQEPISQAAMYEIEEVLKGLDPSEVQQFQRELSVERRQNLFEGEIGELFKKYKPKATERAEKVKNLATLLKNESKAKAEPQPQAHQQSAQGDKPNLDTELLKAKVELELLKQGVPQDFLDEATIVAMSKVKSLTELGKAAEVATKFSALRKGGAPAMPARTSVGIGEPKHEMTDGERVVAYLRQKNPNGWKKM